MVCNAEGGRKYEADVKILNEDRPVFFKVEYVCQVMCVFNWDMLFLQLHGALMGRQQAD